MYKNININIKQIFSKKSFLGRSPRIYNICKYIYIDIYTHAI